MEPADDSSIPVVIATRDRGDAVVVAVQSLLLCHPSPRGIWVVDQSRDERTAEAMGALHDARLHYVRSPTVGQNRAQNLAIAGLDSELVAITDDDCEVPPDWLARVERAFALDPRVAMVFGNVRAAAHDEHAGFVPSYARTSPFIAKKPIDKWRVEGMGACMAIRRAAWVALGGFDEMLGPGAPYPAAGESDLVFRALRAGWWVYETPDIEVLHHGFRSKGEGRKLVAGYARGTGAMMAKHIRCGSPGAPRLLARMAWRWIRRGRPEGLHLGNDYAWTSRLRSFAGGFVAGARTPIDRERGIYRETPSPSGAA